MDDMLVEQIFEQVWVGEGVRAVEAVVMSRSGAGNLVRIVEQPLESLPRYDYL